MNSAETILYCTSLSRNDDIVSALPNIVFVSSVAYRKSRSALFEQTIYKRGFPMREVRELGMGIIVAWTPAWKTMQRLGE